MKRRAWAALAGGLCACASAPVLVAVEELEPTVALDLRYAGSDNFVGAPIDGYQAARCLLTLRAAEALVGVQRELAERDLGLVLYDCYRPQRAVDRFVAWASEPEDAEVRVRYHPNVPKGQLFDEGYIATPSSHSRASTIDAGLVRLEEGEVLDMGTPFDFFDPRSATEAEAIAAEAQANRLLLRDVMQRHGFENYPWEWWHYTLAREPHRERYFDFPIEPPAPRTAEPEPEPQPGSEAEPEAPGRLDRLIGWICPGEDRWWEHLCPRSKAVPAVDAAEPGS